MAKQLNNPAVPALPVAPQAYNPTWGASTLNVLRLYFNQLKALLDNFLDIATGPAGGSQFKFPYGAFYDTTNQHDGSTTIPYAVRLNETSYSNGVSIASRSFSGTGSIGPASTTMTITAVASGRLYPSMLLSGVNVTSGTYVYLQLSSTATNITGTFNYASGGGIGTNTITLDNVTGLEARQFVSGTGVPVNTRITAVDTGTKTITLSANLTIQAAGAYTFKPWGYQGTYSVSPSQTAASATINGQIESLITFDYDGLYNIQYSLQFTNTDLNKDHEVDVWFRKNDVDIADSNSQYSVPGAHAGHNGQLIAAINLYVDVVAGDNIEIVWHTTDSTVYIETIPAATTPIRPSAPSAIVTASFVSALP